MDEPAKKRIRMNDDGGSNQMGDKTGRVIAVARPESSVSGDIEMGKQNEPRKSDKVPKPQEICDLSAQDYLTVSSKLTYRDKTVYLKDFFGSGASVMQTTAPSRMGKSTFMNTIHTFAQAPLDRDGNPVPNREETATYKMFMDKPIGKKHPDTVKAHCAKYPVISLELKNVCGKTEDKIKDSLKTALCKAYKPHGYLLEKDADGSVVGWKNKGLEDLQTFLKYYSKDRRHELTDNDITEGLSFLSEVLHTHYGQKVIILIDECDAPIMKAVVENMADNNLEYMRILLKEMISNALKGQSFTDHVAKALMSGCASISGIYSWDTNNREMFLFLQKSEFAPVYGFTDQEVELLFKERPEFKLVKDIDAIKKWYGGYTAVGNTKITVCNSYSIINYVKNSMIAKEKKFKSYWPNKGFIIILGKLFGRDDVKKQIKKLLMGRTITIKTADPTTANVLELKKLIHDELQTVMKKQIDFFLQLLWDDGILNAVHVDEVSFTATLKIPNLESLTAIQHHCYNESLFDTIVKYKLESENIVRYIKVLTELLQLMRNTEEDNEEVDEGEDEEENDEEVDEGEEDGEEESKDNAIKKTIEELANVVSNLFPYGALPDNESELHHVLYTLAFYNTLFTTHANRPSEIKAIKGHQKQHRKVDVNTPKRKLPLRKGKAKRQEKPKDNCGRKKEFDILITRGTAGILFELKFTKKEDKDESLAGLEQIRDNGYFEVFKQKEHENVKTKLYLGLCFGANANVYIRYILNAIEEQSINHTFVQSAPKSKEPQPSTSC